MIIPSSVNQVLLMIVVDVVGVHCAQSLPNIVKLTLGGLAAELAIGCMRDVRDACCAYAGEEWLARAA